MSELESFVLGYVAEVGGLAEAVGPGMHDLMIPDELAHAWRVSAYQALAFGETTKWADRAFTRVGYNHSLVEQMIEDARAQPAPIHFYVNGLRLQKKGLVRLAEDNWNLPNARVVELHGAIARPVLSTYIRFNFKAASISDEKQEQLVSVLMDAQTGHPAANAERIELAASPYLTDPLLKRLSHAPMHWSLEDGTQATEPLTEPTLQGLLSRAQTVVLRTLADSLSQLQQRTKRFRELDEARLNEYYDEIERDLQKRMRVALPDRRANLEEKLTGIAAERAIKLTDVAERYQVRLDLSLLNLMVISQPKLILPIGIQNRSTKLESYAIWNPLLHQLEALVCGVCSQPGNHIYLCHNGHLAHPECLAPACIDCKRVFCATCTHEIGACDVCQQPLCQRSRIECSTCGLGTCQAHVGECH